MGVLRVQILGFKVLKLVEVIDCHCLTAPMYPSKGLDSGGTPQAITINQPLVNAEP